MIQLIATKVANQLTGIAIAICLIILLAHRANGIDSLCSRRNVSIFRGFSSNSIRVASRTQICDDNRIEMEKDLFTAYRNFWDNARFPHGVLSRYEYWSSILMIVLQLCLAAYVTLFLQFFIDDQGVLLLIWGVLGLGIIVLHFLPLLTATMRRLNDVGANPKLAYLWIFPIFAILMLPFYTCRKGSRSIIPPKDSTPSAWNRFWQTYPNFSGRLTRSQYWKQLFLLFVIPGLLLSLLDPYLHLAGEGLTLLIALIFTLIYLLILPVHLFGMTVRRLTDAGKSGRWSLWLFLPIFGWLPLLIQLLKPSTEIK